jgi:hypothetical protein
MSLIQDFKNRFGFENRSPPVLPKTADIDKTDRFFDKIKKRI